MKKDDLPKQIRLKVSEVTEEKIWQEIEQDGGVKAYSESVNYSASSMYNWKNKQLFYPKEFLADVLDPDETEIKAIKGGSNSKPLENPCFPIPEDNELLTRVQASVYMNKEGIPVYTTKDRSLIERFRNLLREIGEVPISIYNRQKFELRYPKYLHTIFRQMSYTQHRGALIDEKAEVGENYFVLDDRNIAFEEVEELHSRKKKLKMALNRGNEKEIKQMLEKGVKKAEQGFN